jgi:hypothetical protein
MTYTDIAPAHFGHRAVLRSLDVIECRDCGVKLVLPLRADLAPTPQPPPWKLDRSQAASPETVRRLADLARKNLIHVQQQRTSDKPEESA